MQEHINTIEARIVLLAIRRACRLRTNVRRRILVLSDNMLSCLVIDKGRSRSFALNSIARRAGAYQLLVGTAVRVRYLETDRNPADEGSRRFGDHPAKHAATNAGLPPPQTLALADLLP